MPGKSSKHILPNGGLIVIYHGTIRKKSQKTQIQDHWVVFIPLPRAPMTSIFEGQPPQNKAELPIKTRVICVLGMYRKFPYTSLKTNISPENQWLEDVFPIEIVPFFRGHSLVFRGVYRR